MSELKDRMFWAYPTESVDCDGITGSALEVYSKSDVDSVIAKKDKEIQRLENLCASYRHDCDNLAIREANALKEIGRDNRVIRHQKYKRCLAMERWCDAEADVADADGDYEDMRWYQKWHTRWMELAEKFEEVK